MSRIVLGVAGGIAAYKACTLLRLLTEAGHEVRVVPTTSALQFVGAATWAALSGQPVSTEVFESVHEVPHVRLGQQADLVIVAPATADLLARAASGRADDLLTNVLLTASCPVVMAPAMHTEMWQHPAIVANVATLRSRGVIVIDPASGRLTGADSGPGRLPEASELFGIASMLVGEPDVVAAARERDLTGQHVVISAGGTREWLDPVRFLGNASSGLMGVALARAAALRGAEVTLVGAHLAVEAPAGVRLEKVTTTADLAETMNRLSAGADVIVMAAAPADYTPAQPSDVKLKKSGASGLSLELVQTTDILAGLVARRRPGQRIVGFAAETATDPDDLVALGRAKLARKGCDLLVLNDVSGGAVFGSEQTSIVLIDAEGPRARVTAPKAVAAHHILDALGGVATEEK